MENHKFTKDGRHYVSKAWTGRARRQRSKRGRGAEEKERSQREEKQEAGSRAGRSGRRAQGRDEVETRSSRWQATSP